MKQTQRARGAISYREIRREFGNGNEAAGKRLMEDIALRLRHARSKHPVFAHDSEEAVDVIGAEWAELAMAVENGEGPAREYSEVLDTIVTAIRKALDEDKIDEALAMLDDERRPPDGMRECYECGKKIVSQRGDYPRLCAACLAKGREVMRALLDDEKRPPEVRG